MNNVVNAAPSRAEQVMYRECYIAQTQLQARPSYSIRFPLVATRVHAAVNGFTLEELLKKIQPLICDRRTITVHAASDKEAIFSFTNDFDARLGYQLLTGCMEAITSGGSIKFRQWLPIDELGFDVAEQRVRISITNLPLHVWSAPAVEHILSPYCGVEHITDHTHRRIDIRTYRCTAWAQRRIPIPASILLCIPVTKPDPGNSMKTQEYRTLLTYRLKLSTRHYIYGEDEGPKYTPITQVPRYENTYTTEEAICFLPPELVDEHIIKELSAAIVVAGNSKQADALWKDVYYLYPGLDPRDVRMDAISSDKQIIILPNNTAGAAIQKLILSTQQKDMPDLTPWSPDTGSIKGTLNTCVHLMINRIPAHFCTEKLMKLLLAQFCYMEVPDTNAELLLTCESYRCIAWCNNPAAVTKNLIAKVVDTEIASTMILHEDPDVTVRTASILIDVQHTASSINDLLDL